MSLDAAAYQRAAARFGETIVELADEEWELTTHPDDWTVITTVAWVVVGDAQLSAAAAGQALQSVGEFDAAVLGGNPVAAWRGTAVGAIGALRDIDPTSTSCPTSKGRFCSVICWPSASARTWFGRGISGRPRACLLYTSDAADE